MNRRPQPLAVAADEVIEDKADVAYWPDRPPFSGRPRLESCRCCHGRSRRAGRESSRLPTSEAVSHSPRWRTQQEAHGRATLDELLARIKTELTKLGPILDLEVVREQQGSGTEAA